MEEKATKTILDVPVDDILVPHIGKFLSPLDIVNFGECSPQFQEIADRMMQKLTAVFKENEKESGAWNFGHIEKCQSLRVLFLHSEKCLTDEMLGKIVTNNAALETVELINCKQITARGLDVLASAKNLLDLQLTDTDYDNEFIKLLTECNRKLERVRFSLNRKVFNSTLGFFFERQPFLNYVFLKSEEERCVKSLVYAITKNCFRLNFLIMKVPNNGVAKVDAFHVFAKCHRIAYIDITNSCTWMGRFKGSQGKEVLLIDLIDSFERLDIALSER